MLYGDIPGEYSPVLALLLGAPRGLSWLVGIAPMEFLHYITCVVELAVISVILIQILILISLFNSVLKAFSNTFRIEYIDYLLLVIIAYPNWIRGRVILTR